MNQATAATPNLRGKYILSSLRNTKHQQANPTSQHQSSRKTHISAIAKTPHTDPTTTKRAPNPTKTNRKDEGKNLTPTFRSRTAQKQLRQAINSIHFRTKFLPSTRPDVNVSTGTAQDTRSSIRSALKTNIFPNNLLSPPPFPRTHLAISNTAKAVTRRSDHDIDIWAGRSR